MYILSTGVSRFLARWSRLRHSRVGPVHVLLRRSRLKSLLWWLIHRECFVSFVHMLKQSEFVEFVLPCHLWWYNFADLYCRRESEVVVSLRCFPRRGWPPCYPHPGLLALLRLGVRRRDSALISADNKYHWYATLLRFDRCWSRRAVLLHEHINYFGRSASLDCSS